MSDSDTRKPALPYRKGSLAHTLDGLRVGQRAFVEHADKSVQTVIVRRFSGKKFKTERVRVCRSKSLFLIPVTMVERVK